MMINRHNYEEFFLLYVDNELTVAERKAVEAFVEQNPDLEEELVMMMQSVLRPDANLVFNNKEMLLKNRTGNGPVNESNYEEYFVLYGDNELSNEEKDLVEQFVYKHPQYQAEFELIQQARFIPEHATIYPDKNELYRTEKDDKVIPFGWWKIAAAAIVILFLGVAAWYISGDNGKAATTNEGMATVQPATDSNTKKSTAPVNDNNQVAVVKEDNAIKDEKKAVPVKSTPVDLQKNIANNDKKEKNQKASNIPGNKIVTQERIEDKMANNKTPEIKHEPVLDVKRPVVSTAVTTDVVNHKAVVSDPSNALASKEPGSSFKQPAKEIIYIEEAFTEESLKETEASLSKKPVRALLKKVKGLFGSKEDNDPDQENKKGISIAAFEFALK